MNYLGIDYGEAKVGIALAEGPLADPLMTVATKSALSSLQQLIKTYAIEQIIIGDCPTEFKTQLENLGVPVVMVDETLSSHDAREALMHTSQTKRKEQEHEVAAAIILQSWLDAQ
jgi:putative transcription antitermination factor YqgF